MGRTAVVAFLVTAPFALLLPATQRDTVALFAIGAAAISLGISVGGVALMTLRLHHTPGKLQGRVGAVSQSLNAATIPLGALLGGAAGQWLGTRTALVMLAVGYIVFGAAFARSPVRRASGADRG